jgi:hypothetical protein
LVLNNMKNIFKGKLGTVIILTFTVILAGVAIFTALRLYQLRQQPVAPNVPSSIPMAQEVAPETCALTFTISSGSPTPTPTGTPIETPTPTPTTTPDGSPTPTPAATPNSCNGTCGSNYNCGSGLFCSSGFCRNPSCPTETDCVCGTATPTATPVRTGTVASTPIPTAPTLPESGTGWPTILGMGMGILIIAGSLLLAL